MPKFAAHIIIAEEAAARSQRKFGSPEDQNAYRLGSIGPDLTLFLFDAMEGKSDGYKLFMDALGAIDKIGKELEKADSISRTAQGVGDWITGGLASELKNTAALLVEAAIAALKVGLLFDVTVRFKNPFEGLPLAGNIFKVPEIEITPKEYVGAPLRYFGHPYAHDPGFKNPAPVGSYKEWWWMDLLHYRRTLEFGKHLQRISDPGVQRFYADGYLTHIAGDICGHPYVNSMVGGPFRNHAQRHMVLETLMDTWLWDWDGRGDICSAKLHEEVWLSDGNFSMIANVFRDSLIAVYDAPSGGRSRLHPGVGLPSTDELLYAYTGLKTYLKRTTTLSYSKPVAPPDDPGELFEELAKELRNSLERAQFPPPGPITWEWLWAAFSAAVAALAFLFELVTLPLAVVQRLAAIAPRWLLYLIQLALYQFVSEIRWLLALQGWGYASNDDLGRDFVKEQLRAQGFDGYYPFQMSPRKQGFWLHLPKRLGANVERGLTVPGPFRPGSLPDVLITGAPFDQQIASELNALANPAPFSPSGTARALKRVAVNASDSSLWLGNAPDFANMLISGDYPADPLSSFDLDGDRGYGFLSWEEYPSKGERYTRNDGGPL